MKRSHNPATGRFVLMFLVLLSSGYVMVISWGQQPWLWGLALLAFAAGGCSAFAALHETGHGTAFGSRQANRLAAFLAGVAHFYPSNLFRELHFTHHRHTHVPGKDPEISLGHKPMPSMLTQPPLYLSWLTGLPLFLFKVMMTWMGALGMPEPIRNKLYPFVRPGQRARIAAESWGVLAIWLTFAVLAVQVDPGFWSLFIGQAVAHMSLAGYLVMEHNGLPHEGNILEKTRTIRVPRWVRYIMWNMPYHAEHHAYPAVPFHALPQLHEAIKPELINDKLSPAQFHRQTFHGWK
ncbi:MAG: fatty acid desaturase [Bacteroidota bacterium]